MKGKVTITQARKQIGSREYYEARAKNLIAIYTPENHRPYHEQWQIDDYIARAKASALRPAKPIEQWQGRRISNKILNNPNL